MKKIFLAIFAAALCFEASAQFNQAGTTTALWKTPSTALMIQARKDGFKYVEVAMNQFYRKVPKSQIKPLANAMKQMIDSSKMKVWSCHLPFSRTLDISVLDDKKRAENVQFMAEMIELSAMFNPQKLVLHASSEPIEDKDRAQRIANAIESVDILRKYAERIGAQICLENLPRTCIGRTSAEVKQIIEKFPEVGVCIDVNHLLLEEDQSDFIAAVGDRITTLHLSDYDGKDDRHWLPGQGIIKWGEMINQLKEKGYKGVMLFETTKDNLNQPITSAQLKQSRQYIMQQSKKK